MLLIYNFVQKIRNTKGWKLVKGDKIIKKKDHWSSGQLKNEEEKKR